MESKSYDFDEPYYFLDLLEDCEGRKFKGNSYDEASLAAKKFIIPLMLKIFRVLIIQDEKHTKKKYIVKDCPSDLSHLYGPEILPENDYFYYILEYNENGIEKTVECPVLGLLEDQIFWVTNICYLPYIRGTTDPATKLKGNQFNIFPGFQAQIKENLNMSLIQVILDHIWEVWADRKEASYNYILSYLSFPFRCPGDKIKTSLILTGERGVQKMAIIEFIGDMIYGKMNSGIVYYLQSMTSKVGAFPDDIAFAMIDEESPERRPSKIQLDKFRALIRTKNHTSFVVSSSGKSVSCFEGIKDRAFTVFHCSSRFINDNDYLNRLYTSLTQEAGDHLFTYFLNLPEAMRVDI